MGITFGTLKKRLLGELDVIPSSSLEDRINEALRDIYDSNDWGFLFTDAFIRTPAMIEGTANAVQYDSNIVVDAATKTLIDNITVMDVPLVERQLRVTSPRTQIDRGFVYDIIDWDSATSTLVIDPQFQDISNAAVKIRILKIYYTPPEFNTGTISAPEMVTDFKRFEYIFSPQFNRRLNLDTTLEELNRMDPVREYSSDPQSIVPFSSNSYGNPRFELYPSPRFERVLRIKYLRKGLPLVNNTDQVNDILSQELILERAKQKCYKWIMANAHKLTLKSVVPYQNLIALSNNRNDFNSYPNLLERAIKADEERYPKAFQGVFDVPYYDSIYNQLPIGETLVLNF